MSLSEPTAAGGPSPEENPGPLRANPSASARGTPQQRARSTPDGHSVAAPAGTESVTSNAEPAPPETEPVHHDAATDNSLDELASEFLDRHRRGDHPTIQEYAEQNPRLAEEIRDLFPTIAQMEGLRLQVDAEEKQAWNEVQGPVAGDVSLETLGDFRIVREIGRGGMGIVYEAEQTSLKRRVALKVLPLLSLLKPELVQRFEREARTAARLHHTNIVPVFGFNQVGGFHFYVMQLIAGTGLDELAGAPRGTAITDQDVSSEFENSDSRRADFPRSSAARPNQTPVVKTAIECHSAWPDSAARTDVTSSGPPGDVRGGPAVQEPSAAGSGTPALTPHEVADIGIQAAGALSYAHEQGTLHRDIKPGNLLRDHNGRVWVADFGLAKAMEGDEITRSGNVVGTVRYMAPEQLRGEVDPRSDVYSLGITLYELLISRPAWPATERNNLIEQVLHVDLTPPGRINSNVPRDLETIVLKATTREAEHRYQSASALEQDLRCFLEDRPISARRIQPVERLQRWCRRNPLVAGLSGVTVTLLLLIAVVGMIGYRAERLQRARAEQTSILALTALDQIFDQFAPDQSVLISTSNHDSGSPGSAIVSDETAALLEDLLRVYDRLGHRDGDDLQLAVKRAEARRRVGDIRQRLGRHQLAIASYRDSLKRYTELADQLPEQRPALKLRCARISNQIGTSQRMIHQRALADASHRQAQQTLGSLSDKERDTEDVQYELARTHYLLAWRLRPGESPVDDYFHLVLPEDLSAGPPRAGRWNHSQPEGPHPNEITEDQISQYSRATTILNGLQRNRRRSNLAEPPKIAYLLAICLREWYPRRIPVEESPIPGQTAGPETLLTQIVERFPDTQEFRHALAQTYSRFPLHPGELSLVDLYRAESALGKGLLHARILYEDQPTVPAYVRSLIQCHFKLALVQQDLAQFTVLDNREETQQHFTSAERHLRDATALQAWLVRHFPDSPSGHLWLARYRKSIGMVLQLQHRWDDSITELSDAIAELSRIDSTITETDAFRMAFSSLHRELSSAFRQAGRGEQELKHELLAWEYQGRVQDQSLFRRHRRPRRSQAPGDRPRSPPPPHQE